MSSESISLGKEFLGFTVGSVDGAEDAANVRTCGPG